MTSYPTQQELHRLYSYEPDTGLFRWKVKMYRRNPGDVAGSIDSQRHVQLSIKRVLFQAHRIAWIYVYGTVPAGVIDHINGCRSDNRIANLREADGFINTQNIRKPPSTNVTSGMLGVTAVTRSKTNPWQARITANGKQHYLGTFPTANDAHKAYLSAKRLLHQGCTI